MEEGKEREMSKIIHNKIMCRHCKDVIESNFRHHFVKCQCGQCAVDGGRDYLRRQGIKDVDWIELSETEGAQVVLCEEDK